MTEPATTEFNPQDFLKNLTNQPGVYRMLNDKQEVIYVGKAKDLKKRVSSYFRKNVTGAKTRQLVSFITDVEITVTQTETEALILENNLIKQYLPKYNVLLRDDKSYPFILLTEHQHPRIQMHRGAHKKKGEYFGPYPSAGAVAESLRLMQKIFSVRQCEDTFYRARSRPCLQYQLQRCSAPCVGKVSDEDYNKEVELARLFLKGKSQEVISNLVEAMEQASGQLKFEQAAKYRDQIQVMNKIQEQQFVSGTSEELDVIGFHYQNGIAAVHVLFIREQKILGSKNFFPKIPQKTAAAEIMQSFILQFYLNTQARHKIPKEIILADLADNDKQSVVAETAEPGAELGSELDSELDKEQTSIDVAALSEVISKIAEYKVVLKNIQRGEKHRYLMLANKNAQIAVTTTLTSKTATKKRYELLNSFIELDNPIMRMECFDISHTSGEQTIGSCVVFNDEGPHKSEYRRYNIEGITPGDDYAAMDFALAKRYNKVSEEHKIPDVIFIDGGKGQLARAETYFADWTHSKTPMLIGVAKGTSRKPGLETLIFQGGMREVSLPADSPALHLIQHIRDEAHRFAISGHRNKRAKVKNTSTLQQIDGIGPKRRQALLKYMGGLQGILNASVEELAKVPGISAQQAQNVFDSLHDKA
ncbi:MAG: excinuclease ABC subunit C [Phenylobacterium sp.]|jgi:excinuclease ABC subunit C